MSREPAGRVPAIDRPSTVLASDQRADQLVQQRRSSLARDQDDRAGNRVRLATYGGVISRAATLIDGTNIRTPFRGWYLPGDVDMESHGAQPDVALG